jgi:hypothetical protein
LDVMLLEKDVQRNTQPLTRAFILFTASPAL